jgi:AMP-binding enzyme C-terminal domain
LGRNTRPFARKFTDAGKQLCTVSFAYFGRDPAKADAAAAEIRGEHPGAAVMAGNAEVRDATAIAELFARATAQLGAPTVVIAGAAGNFMAPAVGISPNGFKTVVDIDLLGTYIGLPDDRLGEVPVALVEPNPNETIDAAAIRSWSRDKLTAYEVPARVYVT